MYSFLNISKIKFVYFQVPVSGVFVLPVVSVAAVVLNVATVVVSFDGVCAVLCCCYSSSCFCYYCC